MLVFDPALGMIDDQTGESLNGPNTAGNFAAFQQYQAENGPTEGTVTTPALPNNPATNTTGTKTPAQVAADDQAAAARRADIEDKRRSAKADITDALRMFGLEDMADWAYSRVLDDLTSKEIVNELRGTDRYKQRFAANEYRRKAGLNLMSEAEIVTYEDSARQLFREWNVPVSQYDSTDKLAQFMGKDLSVPELGRRVENGYAKVVANPEARAQFRDWYGPDGDTALAMFFFDTDHSLPFLEQAQQSASLGGFGTRYGINLSKDRAEGLIANGVNLDMAPSAFGRVAKLDPLFHETVSETQDLTAEREGVDSAFGQNGTSDALINRRLEERGAAFAGGGSARVGGKTSAFGTANS